MPLDALFLSALTNELKVRLVGAKVDKIYQPEKDEVVFLLRNFSDNCKLLISANANHPRIHITTAQKENPANPPMFCMLLRKHFTGAKIVDVEQLPFERVIKLTFEVYDELGDLKNKQLVLEIMGRQSNILLLCENKLIDSLKHTDISENSSRIIMPGVIYEPPAKQQKIKPIPENFNTDIFKEAIPVEDLLLKTYLAFSPLICREIAFKSDSLSVISDNLTIAQKNKIINELKNLVTTTPKPYIISNENEVLDFSFTEITQYGTKYISTQMDSFSSLLDKFYQSKDNIRRGKQKSAEILRVINQASERIAKKINNQKQELKQCEDRDKFRIYGDLLNANLHLVEKGAKSVTVDNFYDETYAKLTIPLDEKISATANAARYYKKYQKLKTAEKILKEQIEIGAGELEYLETVLVSLKNADTEKDFAEIKRELQAFGIIRKTAPNIKAKKEPPSKPMEFYSTDGFKILVGKNNLQNDEIVKSKSYGDLWLHAQNIPGSHVLIISGGKTIPDSTITEAAILAACFSKASESVNVPVFYTNAKNVKKPGGAKPGFVTFDTYNTAYVTPDKALAERLRIK